MKCPWCVPTICYIGQFFRDMLAEFSDTRGIHKSNNVLGESHLNDTVNYLIEVLLCVQAQKQTALYQKKHHTVASICSHETNTNSLSQLSVTLIYDGGSSYQTVYSCCVKVSPHFSGNLGSWMSSFKLTEKSPCHWCKPSMKSNIPNVVGKKNWFKTTGFPASDLPVAIAFC